LLIFLGDVIVFVKFFYELRYLLSLFFKKKKPFCKKKIYIKFEVKIIFFNNTSKKDVSLVKNKTYRGKYNKDKGRN